MPDHIIESLQLGGHHTRSIALDRDLHDESAIKNYLLTPNAIAALTQIGQGLANGNAQRAWKLVGPYGSGKSALGVIAAQLFSGQTQHPVAWQLLSKTAPKTAALFQDANRYPLVIVGARVSIGVALASAINHALPSWKKNKFTTALKKYLNEEAGTYKGKPLNAVSGELVNDFAHAAQAEGYQGAILLIDEVGKFVEHAALYPEHGDLIALQQIAESACRADDEKLAVITMLHQHFASYAAGVGRALGDEWHKVASRFEEIPFDEPIERYAHFASHALGAKPSVLRNLSIKTQAQSVYDAALQYGVLRAPSLMDQRLFERAEKLYPLHPLCIAALAVVSKRYGQSERSFHAFLRGNELFGLRDFAQRNELAEAPWYRLPNLFDYLSEGYGLRFRDLSAERRWAFALTMIDRHSSDTLGVQILKTVAVLELVQGGLGLPITVDLITFALDSGPPKTVSTVLDRLVGQGLLVQRKNKSEFAFAVSDTVNIEALYERAARHSEDDLMVGGISQVLARRTIVANKHYDTTGTIRTMRVVVGSSESWPQIPTHKPDDAQPDGWLKLVIVLKGSEAEARALGQLKNEKETFSLGACLALSPKGKAALAEYSIWLRIQHEITQKHLDPWSSQYVEGRLHDAQESVERLVLSELLPFPGHEGPQYWHKGQPVPNSQHMNTSQLASWLFETIYSATPHIVNELINKDKLPSPIVLARQRMFDILLSADPTRQICASHEYPPERLIHSTLLRDTGIWQEQDGHWTLASPTASANIDITALWRVISDTLSANEAPTFADVLQALNAPPFGVRAGPAGIWIVLYLLIHRSRCAIFERGTLILELTAEHLQRMYKNPQMFELRQLAQASDSQKLLHDYRLALGAIGVVSNGEVTYLELARSLYRWLGRLSDFTMQTGRVSKDAALVRSVLKKAQDPIKLLTTSLPEVHTQTKTKTPFVDWLSAVLSDIGVAHRNLQDTVSTELCQAFEIAGTLNHMRNQLQAECAGAATDLAEVRLKSFILRCTDLSLTDEKWLDSIASLVVHRPLDSWTDETISTFSQSVTELCGQYKRWMRVVTHRGKAPRAAERFVSLTLTMPGGQESSLFVTTTEKSKKVAQSVMDLIAETTQGDTQLAAAALAQALQELQIPQPGSSSKEEPHGQRETR